MLAADDSGSGSSLAKLYGLYDRDEERVDHSTIDELVGVFHLVTLGAWFFFVAIVARRDSATPHVPRLVTLLVPRDDPRRGVRGAARALRSAEHCCYLQNTLIVGAGDIGQLVARKLLQHPEYGINLVGFVDAHPRRQAGRARAPRAPRAARPPLGSSSRLLDVERVIIAFSDEPDDEAMLATIRELRKLDVQIDIVPRLFEIVGPKARDPHLRGPAARRPAAGAALALVAAAQAHDRLRRRAGDADRCHCAALRAASRFASGSTPRARSSSARAARATTCSSSPPSSSGR